MTSINVINFDSLWSAQKNL